MSDRRSRIAASILALLAGASAWFSAGSVGLTSGDADRVAALPSVSLLILAMIAPVIAAGRGSTERSLAAWFEIP